MKVLQIGMSYLPGGVESFVVDYYRQLVKKDVQFDFICMYDSLAHEKEIERLGGNIYYISNVKKHPLRFRKELSHILLKGGYDVVHVNMLSAANIVPLMVSKKEGIRKVIAHSHNSSSPGIIRNVMHFFNKQFIRWYATDFFACSQVAGEWLFTEDILKSDRYHLINNAIQVDKFLFDAKEREEVQKELGIAGKDVVGHVGRFEDQKNHEFLIEIFREISRENNNAVLLLAGDGELRPQIEEKVKKEGLTDKVIFLGFRTDVSRLWKAMDLFLFPSLFEGLPVTAIESQASGLYGVYSDTITKAVDITNCITFLSLQDSPKVWSEEVLRRLASPRENQDIIRSRFQDKGYDIVYESDRMKQLYQRK